jgi:hypothetical protein
MVGSGEVTQVRPGVARSGWVRRVAVTQVFRTGGTGMCKHMEVFSLLGLKAHYI